IKLSQRGDRALASATAGALLDGNRGRDAEDGVHVRARSGLHELASVSVERFEITPLAFGEQNVEGERALPAARYTGDHGELLARDVDVDASEVVLARVVDLNRAVGTRSRGPARGDATVEIGAGRRPHPARSLHPGLGGALRGRGRR